jgi:hypothetical protein
MILFHLFCFCFKDFISKWANCMLQLHIVKDVVVVFCEAFSHDSSIHPSVPLSIHGWYHIGKKTLAKINNPPFCACVTIRKGILGPRGGHPKIFDINISNKPNIYSPHNARRHTRTYACNHYTAW